MYILTSGGQYDYGNNGGKNDVSGYKSSLGKWRTEYVNRLIYFISAIQCEHW